MEVHARSCLHQRRRPTRRIGDRDIRLTTLRRPFTYNCSFPCIPRRIQPYCLCVHTAKAPSPCRNSSGILAVSVLLAAPASASVVLGGPETLSATPFTFGPSAANQFSLTYPVSGFFNDDFVSTTGTAQVSSFGGFLGIRRRAEHVLHGHAQRQRRDVRAGPVRLLRGFRDRDGYPVTPRPTVSSAFATPSGRTPSTDLRVSPGPILNLMGSRQCPTPTSTQTPRLWRRRSFRPGR